MGRVLVVLKIAIAIAIVDGQSRSKGISKAKINWTDFFCSTWFHWPWLEDTNLMTFSRERVPQKISFVQDCEVDVGTCPVGPCFKCPDSGYICPQTETRNHTCTNSGTWNYEYVSKCVCCTDHGLMVNVKVVDSETKAGIEGIVIRFGKTSVGSTDANGQLMNIIPSDTKTLVISAKDTKDDCLPTVKVYDIIEGLQTSMNAEIVMVRKTYSLEFDSTKSTTICLSKDQNCSASNDGTPRIEIKQKSFRKRGNNTPLYKGIVKASIAVLDDSTRGVDEIIPGRPEATNGYIVDPIVPLITFAIDFRDTNNKTLRLVKNVKIFSFSGGIWNIDLVTGIWKEVKTVPGTKRRKRQISDHTPLSARLETGSWMALGQISTLPKCYVKARVFSESDDTEQSNSATTLYQPEVFAVGSTNDQKIAYYFQATQTLGSSCFEVNCREDGTLSGRIQLKAFETVNGSMTITYLNPKPLVDYVSTIKAKHDIVEYKPTTDQNQQAVYANFIANSDGPFYDNIITCEQADVSKAAFHYIKPDRLSSLSPSTTDAELCTARIGFTDSSDGLFFNYILSLNTLPIIKAVSTWINHLNQYYFTDFNRIEYSNSGKFYFACVKYRCAPQNVKPFDEGIGDTALYLDLLLPSNVEIDANGDGNMVTKNVNCTSRCYGHFCKNKSEYKEGFAQFDGSLFVPRGNDEPDKLFSTDATDTCRASTNTVDFAHVIACLIGDPEK